MVDGFWLSDSAWAAIGPLLPKPAPGAAGTRPAKIRAYSSFSLPVQPIVATHCANFSAGV